ncbi:NAD(P)-binding protein [Acetobacterium paludosum]|uniref:NAD(P)-binding protein n=1 Tax=Acetobacterium paludosum TaxID=52693 RepID=A0A923I215_9FIRM|nr:NAD(P)/FAD-dependent oxidoreductase [Acetobacterium paludosum]MBC3888583.1 NAD(P)-binding protein [Acetobacterium paludosum]
MKKIIIIGGGIAGLSAGIYAQQAGFETEIYEKNSVVGGQCTGWNRKGYFIDNCVHWLTGTKEGTDLYKTWENVGVLGDDVTVLQPDAFYSVELDGETITLWKDLDRTEKELLALSPEDKKEIKKFIANVRMAESMKMPTEKAMDMMNIFEIMKFGLSMGDMGKVIKEYGRINVGELSERFKHPLLKAMIETFMAKEYLAYSLLVSYATFTSGNGGIPEGGSRVMALRMQQRFEDLGGKVYTNTGVSQINIDQLRSAAGIELADGRLVTGDYIICACDPDFTFQQLLNVSYMDKKLKAVYDDRKNNPVISSFHVAFGVDGMLEELTETLLFECESLEIGTQTTNRMSLKNYATYGPNIAPPGKTVIQSQFIQYEQDYDYWVNLAENKSEYEAKKMAIANEVLQRIEAKFPAYQGKIEILDTWTPMTYHRYCNAYHGAYMSFISTISSQTTMFSGNIKALDNVVLGSQWQMNPGGLPTAVIMGKFAVQRILKKDKRKR